MRLGVIARVRRLLGATPLVYDLGAILSLTTLFSLVPLTIARGAGVDDWRFAALAVLAILAAQPACFGAHKLARVTASDSKPLPKMDFAHGLPPELRTLVVVPTLRATSRRSMTP